MRIFTVVRVSLAIAALVAALRLLAPGPLELLDLKLLDLRYRVRGALRPAPEVVVVGLDEASLDEVGRWPWPRSRLASLVDRLGEAGATAIGLDMVFDQPDLTVDVAALRAAIRARPTRPAGELLDALADQDTRFATALRASGRTVLGFYVDMDGTRAARLDAGAARIPELSVRARGGASPDTVPLPTATQLHAAVPVIASAAAGAGHSNFLADQDGLYRRLPIAIRVGDRLAPAFAVELIRRHLGGASASLDVAPSGVTGARIGTIEIPVDGRGQVWVNYLGPPRTVAYVPAADVLAGRAPAGAFAGRMVLVGFTAAGFDENPTPFAPVQPGVELQATVVDNLLLGRELRRPWWIVPGDACAILLFGLGIGVALRRRHTVAGAALGAGIALAYLVATQWAFVRVGLAVGGVYPVAAVVLCTLGGSVFRAVTEEREKRHIRDAFRHYLNPEVTDLLAGDPSRLKLGGERREITVLFSDIRDFTGISERLDPRELAELLNQYLGAMTEVVFKHAGLLDKYVGDAVMAFWGAPVDAPEHARQCCDAALDMLAALARLRRRWTALGWPRLDIRIGINTSQAAVGNFGSPQRFSYTAVGDGVNLASRLEGLNKTYGTRVLISESTRHQIGDDFICREIEHVRVRGRDQRVTAYELLGRRADDIDGRLARRAAAFESALADHRRGARDGAIGTLEALAADAPEDGAVAACLERWRVPTGSGATASR